MSALGIVGGIGPPSTELYYRYAIEYARRRNFGEYPRIVVNSLDSSLGDKILRLLRVGARDDLTALLASEAERLASAGATLVVFASNTVHTVYDDVRALSRVPMVSIVESSADAVSDARRVALIGTSLTVRAGIYQSALTSRHINVVVPDDDEQRDIDNVYFGELVKGDFRDGSREAIVGVIDRLRRERPLDAVLLAGTELPLLIPDADLSGTRLVDTGRAHVEAAVNALTPTGTNGASGDVPRKSVTVRNG